ncbi:MAG: hypothetical protein AABY22_21975 [Nanoarchaeota archaeon]
MECKICGYNLGKKITASEQELKKNFGNFSIDECEIVCNNCYKEIIIWLRKGN